MSGDEKLDQQLDDLLDSYNIDAGLKSSKEVPQIDDYLELSRTDIESMSAEACYAAALSVAEHSFHVQKLYNREKARAEWTNAQVNKLCAAQWDNYDQYMPKDIKFYAIAEENPRINKLMEIKSNATALMNELDSVSFTLKYYASLFGDMAKTKRFNNG
jgi:hypothetical protein